MAVDAFDIVGRMTLHKPAEELNVLNLGAGKSESPISEKLVSAKFNSLTNVEIHRPYFELLDRLPWKTPTVDNVNDTIQNYLDEYRGPQFDTVLLIDVLEHFEKIEAYNVLGSCRVLGRTVLIWIPIGKCKQDPYDDNQYQKHLSTWDLDNFYGAHVEHFPAFHKHFDPPVDAAWVRYSR